MNAYELAQAAGTYLGLKELMPRVLGSSADYLGNELAGLTQKGVENIKRVFEIAERQLGSKINSDGAVSPRVLKNVINEAYFADSEIVAEYIGGVLASSRTNDNRDDRGAYFAKMVAGLSAYQIRSHYVIYQNFKHVFNGKRLPFNHMELHEKAAIHIPLGEYTAAMDCLPYEGLNPYLEHALVGLAKESLISDYYAHVELC